MNTLLALLALYSPLFLLLFFLGFLVYCSTRKDDKQLKKEIEALKAQIENKHG